MQHQKNSMLIVHNKKIINYNKKLCDCCETKCSAQIATVLKYCCFDAVAKGVKRYLNGENIASVDCLRIDKNKTTILLEIKNQTPYNIEIKEISLKIKETMQYLYEQENTLLQKQPIKFYLAIPQEKYTSKFHFNVSMNRFAQNLINQSLSIFNDRPYRIKFDEYEYIIKPKVVNCEETDSMCN